MNVLDRKYVWACAGLSLLAHVGGPTAAQGLQAPQFVGLEQQRLFLTNNSGGLIFEAEGFAVQVGRGGTAAQRSDTDLIIYDPFEGLTERAFDFNASLSDLRIGSGFSSNPGDDGDIFIEDGSGRTTMQLNGSDGGIVLGTTASDGDLQLRNTANAITIQMDGQTGNLTNTFTGNGLIKAWARINSNGTVLSCFRCNISAAQTRRIALGSYEVDFTPFSTNVRARPRTVAIDSHSTGTPKGFAILADRAGDASSVFIRTTDFSGVTADRAFTLAIY